MSNMSEMFDSIYEEYSYYKEQVYAIEKEEDDFIKEHGSNTNIMTDKDIEQYREIYDRYSKACKKLNDVRNTILSLVKSSKNYM